MTKCDWADTSVVVIPVFRLARNGKAGLFGSRSYVLLSIPEIELGGDNLMIWISREDCIAAQRSLSRQRTSASEVLLGLWCAGRVDESVDLGLGGHRGQLRFSNGDDEVASHP
jgi:hypothetical protein